MKMSFYFITFILSASTNKTKIHLRAEVHIKKKSMRMGENGIFSNNIQ